jgi:ribosomal protein S21
MPALMVTARDGEFPERLLDRFTKMVQRDGVLREAKSRRHFMSKGERSRMARKKALRRLAKKVAKDEAPMRG